jgi:hypothetical protein
MYLMDRSSPKKIIGNDYRQPTSLSKIVDRFESTSAAFSASTRTYCSALDLYKRDRMRGQLDN